MKTDETIAIERALRTYNPKALGGITINPMRHGAIAYEVLIESGDITGGIVDAMQVNEYFASVTKTSVCLERHRFDHLYNKQERKDLHDMPPIYPCKLGYSYCRDCPTQCNETSCTRHGFGLELANNSLLITCFEIKVTVSDFKSQHGHNFKGNCNYYVIPSAIYKQVADLLPDSIGVILYDGHGGLRKKIECQFKPLTDTQTMWAVHAILKRNNHGCKYDYDLEGAT